jgi:nucleotide-binding universal stress UspA family protein
VAGIVVGVDGSGHSRQALAWAMREAAQHHVLLTVIAVHPAPIRPATRIYWNVPDYASNFDPEPTHKAVQELVDQVASEMTEAPPEVTVSVVQGDPADELIKASRDADLLVVGSRGSGGFTNLLLGSVTGKVTHHAASPVVVVPANRYR